MAWAASPSCSNRTGLMLGYLGGTLLAIAVVPLHRRNCLHQIEHMLGRHIAQGIGRAGKGFFLVVGAPHATAQVSLYDPAPGKALALARRLVIALWKYLKQGEIPVGAALKPAVG